VLRQTERVTPLELFFDLVFVLALTQCTALMAAEPTWTGLGKGVLVLGVLWWSWVGYAWLTSVVDPEEGGVRLVMFAAMAALLVAALCVPDAFGDDALLFACAYGIVRAAQIALFLLASRDNEALRQSVLGLAGGSAVGVGLLIAASGLDGWAQGGLWVLALLLDMAEPFFFGSSGWSLEHPSHFAERHGLIIIIAIGESIVALGIGAAGTPLSAGVITAALLGITIAAALWWAYFDWVSIVVEQQLRRATGTQQTTLARDCYSYLHFVMVTGIVLFAVSMKKTLADYDAHLGPVPTAALCGGLALYLLAHVLLRLRIAGLVGTSVGFFRRIGRGRPLAMLALLVFWPFAGDVPALAAVAFVAAVFVALIAYEAIRYRVPRSEIRHGAIATEEIMAPPHLRANR